MARTQTVALTTRAARERGLTAAEETRQRTRQAVEQDAGQREAYASSGLPPDWLTTGVTGAGVGWLFGPVGGLVGAAVASVLSKRRRDGIAAQATADAETASSLIDGGARALDRLAAAAETDQDKLEVELLRDQYDAAVTLARHPDGQVALEGFRTLLSLPGLADQEADEIEKAQLDAAAREREKFKAESDRAVALRDRLQTESRSFIDAERQFSNLQQLLAQDPTNLDATTAIFTFAKLVNPGEITTEGDIQALSAGGNISSALARRLNDVILGQAYLDETIKGEMLEAAKDLMRTQRAEQIQRNQLARDFAKDLDIRDELVRNILVPVNTKPEALVPVKQSRELALVDPSSPAGKIANDVGESVVGFFGLEPGEDIVRYQGQDFRIIDHGNGRREWEPIPDAAEARRQQSADRMLETPGLFQPGGAFGRALSPDEVARRDELRRRRRSVNE